MCVCVCVCLYVCISACHVHPISVFEAVERFFLNKTYRRTEQKQSETNSKRTPSECRHAFQFPGTDRQPLPQDGRISLYSYT